MISFTDKKSYVLCDDEVKGKKAVPKKKLVAMASEKEDTVVIKYWCSRQVFGTFNYKEVSEPVADSAVDLLNKLNALFFSNKS